jgi:hypothetical protein
MGYLRYNSIEDRSAGVVAAFDVGWNGVMQDPRTLATKLAYRLVLPLFLLSAGAWLSLTGLNSLLDNVNFIWVWLL